MTDTRRFICTISRWLLWIFMSTVGYYVALVMHLLVVLLTGLSGAGYFISVLVAVIVFTTCQRLALVGQVSSSWMLPSIAGYAIGIAIVLVAYGQDDLAPWGSAIAGLVVGTMQWQVLRTRFSQAGWWVLASAVGWAIGSVVMNEWASEQGGCSGWEYLYLLPLIIFPGPVIGIITGFPLVWLLQNPLPGLESSK